VILEISFPGYLQDPPHYFRENRYDRRAFSSSLMRDIADEEVALFMLRTHFRNCNFVEQHTIVRAAPFAA
jgi:hypothetical protein